MSETGASSHENTMEIGAADGSGHQGQGSAMPPGYAPPSGHSGPPPGYPVPPGYLAPPGYGPGPGPAYGPGPGYRLAVPPHRDPGKPGELQAREISAWFGDRKVLDRGSLTMPAGRVTALIG